MLALSLLAPNFLCAQLETPRIGVIDLYGLRRVPAEQVRQVLGLKEGDPLPSSKSDLEEHLQQMISGVTRAQLAIFCCDAGQATVYVGIEEEDTPRLDFRRPPDSAVVLPQEIVETYDRFGVALAEAVRKGDTADDLSQGHSLLANPVARALQQQFLIHAASHRETLRNVLRNSADGRQRAIAAAVLGYAPKKSDIVEDLHYAISDPEPEVRNNAMRALWAIAMLANREPQLGIQIPVAGFIELLNSVVWSDRNKAVLVLMMLTESRDPGLLAELRQRALASLVEIARWKSPGHALPAFAVLGWVAGLTDEELRESWTCGDREAAIERMLKLATKTPE